MQCFSVSIYKKQKEPYKFADWGKMINFVLLEQQTFKQSDDIEQLSIQCLFEILEIIYLESDT